MTTITHHFVFGFFLRPFMGGLQQETTVLHGGIGQLTTFLESIHDLSGALSLQYICF
jgi:hypothetical protein